MFSRSPYRTLPTPQRLTLVAHEIANNRESRDGYIRSIVSRGGGFRPEKLRKWPPDQLAREIVRHNLETPQDELSLMVALYVELEPAIQVAFLDLAGVAHDGASIPEDLTPPFADATTVRSAAETLLQQHGDDARRYLRTIAMYNGDAWPGLADMVAEMA
jgi:hypothetical protein